MDKVFDIKKEKQSKIPVTHIDGTGRFNGK